MKKTDGMTTSFIKLAGLLLVLTHIVYSGTTIDHSFLKRQTYLEDPLYSNETFYDEDPYSTWPDADQSQFLISKRTGSFEADVYDTAEDVKGRIKNVLKAIRKSIGPTIKSIEGDIFKLNRDRVIIAVANWLASSFNMLAGANAEVNFNKISAGARIQVLSAAMYGYGYSRPWQDAYEPPLLDCGHKEFEEALQEYAFLDNPDPENDISILVFYTTELNHVIKNKLYCISQRKGTNQEAKELIALIDLYTELQQEFFEAVLEEEELEEESEELQG